MNDLQITGLIKGFTPIKTHHCVTGSMRNIYEFNQYPVLEEVLFGIGSGIGFAYLEIKGAIPFMGGRGNVGRKGEEGIEITAAKRTGVYAQHYKTGSPKKAENRLLELLTNGTPVMLYADMGFLPYFKLPPGIHFGAHMIVAAGYDPQTSTVLIAERDGLLHPVLLPDLAQARHSKFKPFPPHNVWFEMDFSRAHPIAVEDVRQAIYETSEKMIKPPISSLGVKGIYKAAQRIPRWAEILDFHELIEAVRNGYIYIDYTGGTGGGLFRYLYGRFLHEAVDITGIADLEEISKQFKTIGDRWQEVALLFKEFSPSKNPGKSLREIGAKLLTIADLEKAAWGQLYHIIR
ncbi:MAG: BtrH N-terminal domain-containing protein [Anaerolineales bacterium]|nr:BtrH N-terminal domain-containing protein [Anaerolineales bacterium]